MAELCLDALRLSTLEALLHAARKVVFDVLLGVLEASGEGRGEVAVRPEGVHDGPDLVESIPLLLFAGRDILGRDDDVGDGGAAVAVDLTEVFAGLLLIGGRDAVFAGAAVLSGECDLVGVHCGLLSSWPGRSRGSWWCRVPEKQKHDRRIASESSAEGGAQLVHFQRRGRVIVFMLDSPFFGPALPGVLGYCAAGARLPLRLKLSRSRLSASSALYPSRWLASSVPVAPRWSSL